MIAGISQQQDRLEREKYMEYTLNELEKRIGYSFQDKKLLEHAMIHSSYANEHHLGKLGCNERLEFLGDAVLEVVSSDFLFRTFPEMPEGDMTQTPLKIPGLKKYGNITLKQGLVDSMVLYEWMTAGLEGDVERKTLTITLLDIAGSPAASWQIINAWPVKYTAPDFNATSSEVAIESLEIAHEGMTRVS